eukprot:UN3793
MTYKMAGDQRFYVTTHVVCEGHLGYHAGVETFRYGRVGRGRGSAEYVVCQTLRLLMSRGIKARVIRDRVWDMTDVISYPWLL